MSRIQPAHATQFALAADRAESFVEAAGDPSDDYGCDDDYSRTDYGPRKRRI